MPGGLAATFEVLGATANEAAVPVLVAALSSPRRELRDLAFTALLGRHGPVAEAEVLLRWRKLPDPWRRQIAVRTGWLTNAVRQALLRAEREPYECACEAAVYTRDFDVIPVLVAAAENKSHPHGALAAATVLELAELLAEELSSPRDYRIRRDPQLQRQHLLGSLERAASQFDQHGRRELIEALVLLADRENAVLKQILQTPVDRNFVPLVDVLIQSSRTATMRLLLTYLADSHAPLAALHALARRRDISFLRQLVRQIGSEPTRIITSNLRRIESIPWISEQLSLLDTFNEGEQPGVVQLAALSGIPRQQAYEILAYVLRHGKVSGRRTAARALGAFQGADANNLAVKSLGDDDAEVRATIALQLRDRGVPGAINRLIALLDSTHQVEREAAQASLAEFRFANFAKNFDGLNEEARRSSGPLVRRIDPQSLVELRLELDAPTRSRRKRGLEMAVAMDAVVLLHDAVVALLKDDDQYLRIEAVRALASCDSSRTRQVLREALLDPHPLVVEAAEGVLAKLAATSAAVPESVENQPAKLEGSSRPTERFVGPVPPAEQLLTELADAVVTES
jgi:HEAT repeat protein